MSKKNTKGCDVQGGVNGRIVSIHDRGEMGYPVIRGGEKLAEVRKDETVGPLNLAIGLGMPRGGELVMDMEQGGEKAKGRVSKLFALVADEGDHRGEGENPNSEDFSRDGFAGLIHAGGNDEEFGKGILHDQEMLITLRVRKGPQKIHMNSVVK